jgi:O-antigen/teichoic acid export membrane protein
MGESTLKEKTSRGLFWGGMSSFFQQLLNAVFGIYLARVLSPDDYGLVGMLAIFNMVVLLLQESGFVSALINRKEIRHEDYNSVFWFSVLLSAVCYIVLFFAAPAIARYFHRPELVNLARWSFLGFLIGSLGVAPGAYLSKKLMVKEKSMAALLAVVVSGGVGVLMASRGFAYWSLVVQSLVNWLVLVTCYWIFSRWHPVFRFTIKPLQEMFHYGSKLLLTGLLNIISGNIVSVILGRCYSAREVGVYTQANKWGQMGSNFLTTMVNGVAQPVLFEVSSSRERQLRVCRKMIRFAAFVSFPLMLGLAFIAPEFITIAITDKWKDSIVLLQILCVGFACAPISAVCYNLLLSKGRANEYLWASAILSILTIAVIFLLYPVGIQWMTLGVTVVNVLTLVVWLLLVRREVDYTFKGILLDLIPFLGLTLLGMAAAWLVLHRVDNLYISLVGKIAIVGAVYILGLRLLQSEILRECTNFIFRKRNDNENREV